MCGNYKQVKGSQCFFVTAAEIFIMQCWMCFYMCVLYSLVWNLPAEHIIIYELGVFRTSIAKKHAHIRNLHSLPPYALTYTGRVTKHISNIQARKWFLPFIYVRACACACLIRTFFGLFSNTYSIFRLKCFPGICHWTACVWCLSI